MIISQTPLRISLAGGGTDLPNYYTGHQGLVVSTAIDKYLYVIVNERFDNLIYVDYSKKEIVDSIDDIQHDLVRESAKITNMKFGFEVLMLADIPSEGSGLGSSSSLTVGLLNAFYQYQGIQVSQEELARKACEIEINILKKPIGRQDQYIAAYGGLKCFQFNKDHSVEVLNLNINSEHRRRLGSNLLLFFTNTTRKSSSILEEQNNSVNSKIDYYDNIKNLAVKSRDALNNHELDKIGSYLKENWEMKKKLASNITNPEIEIMHETAMNSGALGAKISGAGGGGFLLVYCERKNQDKLRHAMREYRELPFLLEQYGSKIIFNQTRYDIK